MKWPKARSPTGASEAFEGPRSSVTVEDAEEDLNEALWQLGTAVGLSIAADLPHAGRPVRRRDELAARDGRRSAGLHRRAGFALCVSKHALAELGSGRNSSERNLRRQQHHPRRLPQAPSRRRHEPGEAAVAAGRKRLRPILITSVTTILGMLPDGASGSATEDAFCNRSGSPSAADSGSRWVSRCSSCPRCK